MSALAIVTKPADQSTDDLDLVAAVRAGDDRAFELLFIRYESRIAAYVRGMVRDHGRAEDITQEVFIAALRRMRETDGHIAFKPWIYEIAKNACIDAFRRARHANEVSFDADEGLGPSIVDRGGAPDTLVESKLAIDNLCGALGGLSQMHHDILVMREFEGLTYAEIGDRLGLSRAAVESTLFRARRRLGEEYDELVSGERCIRVRGIVDAPPGRAVGLRDQRRMARHVAHCQPCRRYARLAGADLAPRVPSVAARIAALLPLPTFVRRRCDLDDGGTLLSQHSAPALQWSTKVVAVLDPATVSGWPKAIATAATVAVAGLGAGAAVGERQTLTQFVSRMPAVAGVTAPVSASHGRASRGHAPASAGGSLQAGTGTAGAGTPALGSAGRDSTIADSHTPATTAPRDEQPVVAPDPRADPAAGVDPAPVDPVTGIGAAVPDMSQAGVPSQLDHVTGDEPAHRGPVGSVLDRLGQAIGGGGSASRPAGAGDTAATTAGAAPQGTTTGAGGTSGSGGSSGGGGGGASTGTGAPSVPGSISLTTAGGSTGTSAGSALATVLGQALGAGGPGPS